MSKYKSKELQGHITLIVIVGLMILLGLGAQAHQML